MRVIKIEYLCELYKSLYSPGDILVSLGQYKLFFKDGSSCIQDYVLPKEFNEAQSIAKVIEFSEKV
jgi:hypothetical protein